MTPGCCWLGLRRDSLGGQFYWPSGHAVTYTNWHEGQPNDNSTDNLCVYLSNNGWEGKWFTWPCDNGVCMTLCEAKAT